MPGWGSEANPEAGGRAGGALGTKIEEHPILTVGAVALVASGGAIIGEGLAEVYTTLEGTILYCGGPAGVAVVSRVGPTLTSAISWLPGGGGAVAPATTVVEKSLAEQPAAPEAAAVEGRTVAAAEQPAAAATAEQPVAGATTAEQPAAEVAEKEAAVGAKEAAAEARATAPTIKPRPKRPEDRTPEEAAQAQRDYRGYKDREEETPPLGISRGMSLYSSFPAGRRSCARPPSGAAGRRSPSCRGSA